ncbi:MAG: hypothetical protein SFW09_04460 [Hyphomicrobiaceae bacterium]|nr:hypothetical protein [Hyphomicrobiaceae bacterium]
MVVAGIGAIAAAFAPANGETRGATPAQSPRVDHGAALTAAMTGPIAAGITPRGRFAGETLRDGRSYPFAREVPHGARYDGYAVPGPHLLIEGVGFTSPIDIFTSRTVVMRGVTVATASPAHWAIYSRPSAGALYFLWSEAGAVSTEGAPDDRSYWLARALYLASDNAVVYRSHLTRAADGIQVHGRGTRIVESVIDGLVHWRDDHNDGVQMLGRAADLIVERSRIENANPLVACLNLNGDRVRVLSNYLAGGGYALYGGARRNGQDQTATTRDVVVIDNVFGRDFFPKAGRHGPLTYWDASPSTGNVWRGNRYSDSMPIPPPSPTGAPARR